MDSHSMSRSLRRVSGDAPEMVREPIDWAELFASVARCDHGSREKLDEQCAAYSKSKDAVDAVSKALYDATRRHVSLDETFGPNTDAVFTSIVTHIGPMVTNGENFRMVTSSVNSAERLALMLRHWNDDTRSYESFQRVLSHDVSQQQLALLEEAGADRSATKADAYTRYLPAAISLMHGKLPSQHDASLLHESDRGLSGMIDVALHGVPSRCIGICGRSGGGGTLSAFMLNDTHRLEYSFKESCRMAVMMDPDSVIADITAHPRHAMAAHLLAAVVEFGLPMESKIAADVFAHADLMAACSCVRASRCDINICRMALPLVQTAAPGILSSHREPHGHLAKLASAGLTSQEQCGLVSSILDAWQADSENPKYHPGLFETDNDQTNAFAPWTLITRPMPAIMAAWVASLPHATVEISMMPAFVQHRDDMLHARMAATHIHLCRRLGPHGERLADQAVAACLRMTMGIDTSTDPRHAKAAFSSSVLGFMHSCS